MNKLWDLLEGKTEQASNGKTVTLLHGSWPQWYGNLGKWFIYVRIRHGASYIGVGRSKPEAQIKSALVRECDSLRGVTGVEEAIKELGRAGYKVASRIVPEHIEEVS